MKYIIIYTLFFYSTFILGVDLSRCFLFFSKLVTKEEPRLSPEQLETLRSWASWNAVNKPSALGPSMKYEIKQTAFLILSELPFDILERVLTTKDGKTIYPAKKLANWGIDFYRVPALIFVKEYLFDSINGFSNLQKKINESLSLPEKEKERLRKEWERAIEKYEIESILSQRQTPEYRILIRGNNIVLPDGAAYTIVKRLWSGGLVIEIPRGKTLGFNMGQHLKDYLSDTYLRIEGRFTPDGRFMVNTPYDWANALTSSKDRIRVIIRPEKDGNFYSYSHYEIMYLYAPRWFDEFMDSVCDKGCEIIREKVEVSPSEFIRSYYYEVLRLPKPEK